MSNAVANIENMVRRLRPADLEQVITIDSENVGETRRAFFEKRLANARERPADYVQIGVAREGTLVGFAFARVLRGEFGRDQAIATLDAVGVMTGSREIGIGRALMGGLTKALCQEGIRSLQSQADWTNHALLRFFDASGFNLAPRLVLERSALMPLPESVDGD
jgi:ribosomal protein S18 acetylase RimI-like enzyme